MLDFVKILCIVILGAICISSEVLASTLNSVELKPTLNNFDVILNSTDKIKTQKTFSHDKMIITLKNTKPSQDFSVKYNSSDLDNVIVKTNKKDTKIIIKSNKIIPPVKDNNLVYYVFGLLTVGILFSKLVNNDKKETEFVSKQSYTNNLDFLIQHKIKQKEAQKTKIAA